MRAAFAVLRLCAASSLALSLCSACARPAQGPLPGASDAWAKPADVAPAPAPAAPTWDSYAAVSAWPTMNGAPFTSRGHQPEQAVDIRVSPEIRTTYSALVTDSVFPDGAVLAELAHAGEGRGYAMRKVSGSWLYFELDAHGGVLSNGALALCAGCHAQAPADGVFGLPREVTPNR